MVFSYAITAFLRALPGFARLVGAFANTCPFRTEKPYPAHRIGFFVPDGISARSVRFRTPCRRICKCLPIPRWEAAFPHFLSGFSSPAAFPRALSGSARLVGASANACPFRTLKTHIRAPYRVFRPPDGISARSARFRTPCRRVCKYLPVPRREAAFRKFGHKSRHRNIESGEPLSIQVSD